jgi:LuxR family transcriptional regulator, maltose regulon positive regulatory protein
LPGPQPTPRTAAGDDPANGEGGRRIPTGCRRTTLSAVGLAGDPVPVAGATQLGKQPLTAERAVRPYLAPELLEPKYGPPVAREAFVRRTELLRRLDEARSRPLVLVTAPAGYGKTTLLAQWFAQGARTSAWITLDDADGDPEVLADAVATALARIGVGPAADLDRSFRLVLDDAHLVAPHVLRDAVVGLLAWLPVGSQVALASRCEPSLPLGRMRAHRMLVEVNAQDLSMSAAEAASLLHMAGLNLEFTAVQELVGQTEGWPVALELAATSCALGPEPPERLARFAGDDHLISEYFRAEFLATLPAATRRFLIRSSVLDRLSGPLCDAVLERKRSATVLAELARANVPLQPVDWTHEWYRLHDLFREMLQAELRRAEPQIQPALHRRAGDWHRSAGNIDRAIEHALGAEDLDRAGELLWANLLRYLGEGRNDAVQRWLSGVTAHQAAGCAPLALAAAHSHLALGNIAAAEQWGRSAAVALSEAPSGSAKPERAGAVIIEAWAARSGATRMGEDAARAAELLPEDSPWRASCCFLRGTAALLSGEHAEAERLLEEGAARGAHLAADAASLCLAQLAVVATEHDDTELACDFARRAGAVVREHNLSKYPASALVFAVSAATGVSEGRVDQGKAAAAQCLSLMHALDEFVPWFAAEARILLARVSLALGDVAGARELLACASRLARRSPGVVVFRRWFDEAWDQFDARAESALAGVASLTTAELRVLRFLPTHYSFHEIAERLQVSSNTVKTHVHAVYRKLDASSRSEAVAHATRAGLVCS